MNGWGWVYRNATFYRATMAILRPVKTQNEMSRRLAEEIGTLSVLELCCGVGDLRRSISSTDYQGIDKNPAFSRRLAELGVRVAEGDILSINWPPAECLVMVDSLYHFIHNLDSLISKMKVFPCRKIIISEPVENLFHRLPGWLVPLAAWVTRVDGRTFPQRFTEDQLTQFFRQQGFKKVYRVGPNCVGVWERHE